MVFLCSLFITIAVLPVQYVLASVLPEQPFPRSSQSYIRDHLGAVASQSSLCSQIGIDLLKNGGNAADAVRCLLNVSLSRLTG